MNIGVWHNGTTNLPAKRTDSGLLVPDASLRELHEDKQQIVNNRIEHAVLAEEHGFDRVTFTEHHFITTGSEFSPNPLMTQMAIAAQTERIALRQVANILNWHDPLRIAEQTALLDVVSGGRTEIGIGRGYQNREAEILGQYWGGGVQDQEKNRKSFEEKFEILKKAWTEDMFSYHGEFHQVPPSYTKHHHPQERAYLADDVSEYEPDDMIDWRDEDGEVLLNSGSSTLKSISVFPQPLQDPHPPLWQPVTSSRSIRFAAERGINAYITGNRKMSLVKSTVDKYHEAVEEAGWPDVRPEYDGEPFAKGWDEDRQRGISLFQPVFNTDVADDDTFDRWKRGLVAHKHNTGWYGLTAGIAEDDEELAELQYDLTANHFIDRGTHFVGGTEDIIDQLAGIWETLDVDDLSLDIGFDMDGITGEEGNEQLVAFAEDVLPYLHEEFGH